MTTRLTKGLLTVAAVATLAGGCTKKSGTGAAKEDMQLVPKEAEVVFMLNVPRLRNTAMWRKAIEKLASNEGTKKDYENFVKKCDFDPMKQLDSVFAALPNNSQDKEFALVVRGTFDAPKLMECMKEQAAKDGRSVVTEDYKGHQLFTDNADKQAYGAFIDGHLAVLGGKTWAKKVIDQVDSKEVVASAKDNANLMALVKRARTSDAFWGAGVVPDSARDMLKTDPQLAQVSGLKNIFGSLDFQSGVALDFNVDTGSESDAKLINDKVQTQLAEVKKNPTVMMLGMNTIIENVKVAAKGPTLTVNVNMNQQQADDMTARLEGVAKMLGASMAGGMGGGMGGAPSMAAPPGLPPGFTPPPGTMALQPPTITPPAATPTKK